MARWVLAVRAALAVWVFRVALAVRAALAVCVFRVALAVRAALTVCVFRVALAVRAVRAALVVCADRAVLAVCTVLAAFPARAVRAPRTVPPAFPVLAIRAALLARAVLFTFGSLLTVALARARFVARPLVLNARPFTLFIAVAAGRPWFTEANCALFLLANRWCATWVAVGGS